MLEKAWVERLPYVVDAWTFGQVGAGYWAIAGGVRGDETNFWEVGTFQWVMRFCLPASERVVIMRYYDVH